MNTYIEADQSEVIAVRDHEVLVNPTAPVVALSRDVPTSNIADLDIFAPEVAPVLACYRRQRWPIH